MSYTVSSIDYSGLVSSISGTFTVTIACPVNPITQSWTTTTATPTSYDLAVGGTVSLSLPSLTLTPACLTVTGF